MNRPKRTYVPLMDIKVISSDLGQLFAFSMNGSYSDTRCGSSLHSDKALDYCRFVVLGSDGKEKAGTLSSATPTTKTPGSPLWSMTGSLTIQNLLCLLRTLPQVM